MGFRGGLGSLLGVGWAGGQVGSYLKTISRAPSAEHERPMSGRGGSESKGRRLFLPRDAIAFSGGFIHKT